MCVSGVENVSFLETFAYVLNEEAHTYRTIYDESICSTLQKNQTDFWKSF